MRSIISLLFISTALLSSCRKHVGPDINRSNIIIKVSHQVDGGNLIFDSTRYINSAGNVYSVERLQYYLSSIRLFKNGKLYFLDQNAYFVDARKDSVTSITIPLQSGLASGIYDSIAFFIGVDSLLNSSGGLPHTLDNINMEWPEAMGGGYHFLKLEGHYKDGYLSAGYAMHMGCNGFQVKTGAKCSLEVKAANAPELKMVMNVNEWFCNPHVYDFNTDGVFSMGDTVLMTKLKENGADVFYSN